MAQQSERPKHQGDPLEDVIDSNTEENRAQRDSDAPPDATAELGGDALEDSERAGGRGSDANGIPASDEADGDTRKKLYRDGATLVSRID